MRTLLLAAALIVPAAAHADQRQWSPGRFDRVESAGSYDVTVVPGPVASVRAEGDRDALERMRVAVEDGSLQIGTEHHWGFGDWHRSRIHVTVTAPVPLRGASLAGSGNMVVARVEGPSFKGSIAGSGNMVLRSVDARALALSVAGSGTVTASGRVEHMSADIAGSGDARLEALHAVDLTANIAGSGSMIAFANRTATLSIMGSGDVRVRGGARCTVSKAGSGRATCTA